MDYLSKVNLEVLENVWTTFGSLNEFSLSELTHYYPGWKNWYSYYDNESFFTPIDPEKRKEILKKFNVLDPVIDNELLKDSKDIAIERGIIHECNFLNQVEM